MALTPRIAAETLALGIGGYWRVLALVAQGTAVSIVPAPLARSQMQGVRFVALEQSFDSEVHAVWPRHRDQPARDLFLGLLPFPGAGA